MRSSLALGLALVLALLAGCVSPGANVTPSSTLGDATHFAFGAVKKIGSDGNEPVMRVAPDGTIYLAALQYVWVSLDNGTTFKQVDATGGLPIYASDSALAVAPDGRAYVAFDWPYAGQTAVCTSADRGASWACQPIVVAGASDRMWVVAPTAKDAYVITGETLDRPTFAVTHDAGKSWTQTSQDLQDTCQGSDLTWDPVAKVVVEAACGVVREWKPDGTRLPDIKAGRVAELQIDSAGAWWGLGCANETGSCEIAVKRSADSGKTWTAFPLATQRNVELPYVTASAPGHVAVAWYESNGTAPDDAANEWRVTVAQTPDGGAHWTQAVVSGDKPVHKGAMCSSASCLGEDRFAGDFLGVAFGPGDAALHATWMRQTGTKGVPTTQLRTQAWDDVEYARTS